MRRTLASAALPLLLLAQCAPQCEDAPTARDAAQDVEPGDCTSYGPLLAAFDLPVQTFERIAWRESGCDHTSFVIDRDDAGGGLLGINLKGRQLSSGYYRWCGATLANITDPVVNVRCAAAAYHRLGMRPWRT